MEPTPEDKLVASVFALGLRLGSVPREDVVRWADGRIEEIEQPPAWLIDLSLSESRHIMDLISDLRRVASGVAPVDTLKTVYALLPEPKEWTFEKAEEFAGRLYRLTHECLSGDWSHELVRTTDRLADEFEFQREGYLSVSRDSLIGAVRRFLNQNRDEESVRLLRPIRWRIDGGESGRL